MTSSVAPFVIFFIGGLIAASTRGWIRSSLMLMLPVVGALNLMGFEHGSYWTPTLAGWQLEIVKVDKLSILFGYLFHLAGFLGVLYALHVKDTTQQVASVLYAGSALGAVFAGDLITLFIFWELLAVTSVFLIWARRTERAYEAGQRYLIIQVVSGVILLAGVMFRAHDTGSIAIEKIGLDGSIGSWLIFFALGVKACFPALHNWLTDAYPEATPTGTVYLSAFTTKVAVYALARMFPGTELLVYIGGMMAMFPIFFAVIENDLRRVLAYSLINQVGFMVVGVGLGTELALNGTVSHAFNDVIFKGLLFMTMGAVLKQTGEMRGSELGGLYKKMPFTTWCCIVGAASISAFPLFSGFVSKSMVMVATLEEGHPMIWLALLFASAGVFHHAGIKIPFFAFFAHEPAHKWVKDGKPVQEAPWNMLAAMAIASALCIFNGSYPAVLYSMLPYDTGYQPYDATHVLAQLQLLFFSALAFCWLNLANLYPPELRSTNIDAEWIYRKLLPGAVSAFLRIFGPLDRGLRTFALSRVDNILGHVFRHHGPHGVLARTWATGSTVLWIAILLVVYLLVYYL